jgi:membrane-bound lytic murein transglycosylase D
LPKLTGKDVPQELIPQAYLCPPGKPQDALDPKLVQEVQTFLEESGMLSGFPASTATEVPVVLNKPVQFYVTHFSRDKRGLFANYLARSGRYLATMRQILQEHGLPPDLVYLALVESGFNPWAVSPAEAVGPWQFIEGTARRYGLQVNAFVDERRDPEKSTRAAARYLKDLYQQFGCWYLAAAGYNAGEKRVEKTMSRSGSRDFWLMRQKSLLPQETCNYVPQFIAAALIARNPQKYGFDKISYQRPPRYDRIQVPGGADLRWFADSLDISYEELRELNPELKQSIIPLDQAGYTLKVPSYKKREAHRLAVLCWKKGGVAPAAQRPGP